MKASFDSVNPHSDVWGATGTEIFLSLINQICGPPGYQHNGNIGLEPLSCNSITHCVTLRSYKSKFQTHFRQPPRTLSSHPSQRPFFLDANRFLIRPRAGGYGLPVSLRPPGRCDCAWAPAVEPGMKLLMRAFCQRWVDSPNGESSWTREGCFYWEANSSGFLRPYR